MIEQYKQVAGLIIDPVTGAVTNSYTTEEGTTVTEQTEVIWSYPRAHRQGVWGEICELCGTIQSSDKMARIKGKWYCFKFGCAQEVSS